jgi:hypothetical protein
MDNTVKFRSQSTNGPSYEIWHDCPVAEIHQDPAVGYGHFDDFVHCPTLSAGAGDSLNYLAYGDTGVTIKAQAGVSGGVAEVAGNDADNDESVLSTGAPAFVVSDTASAARKLWYECRIKKASIANNACALFNGLAWDHGDGVSVAKTICLTDDDANLGAFSFLGFHVDQADGDAIDFVVKAEGGAQTVIKAGVAVPEADTWIKLGFKYDPDEVTSKRIKIYVDNVLQSTFVTGTQIAAATFPDAEPMAMAWAAKVGAAAESKAQMDWWRCYQLR